MASLEVRQVSKRYGGVSALQGVSVAVGEGEFLTLLGPSGCGKSTLLGLIAGTIEGGEGEIHIAERRVDGLPAERRDIGMVFQSYALFPHMRVYDNVAFGLRMRKVGEAQVKQRVGEMLERVSLLPMAERYPRQLSGGQQQRVALARALVIEPSVLLLDEPLSNLDARLREQLRDELRALHQRSRITSIYVTHDQAEALALSDRIVVMNQGQVVEVGTPVELYRTPKRRFTAEFLGNTNLIRAVGEGRVLHLPWGEKVPCRNSVSGPVLLSLRPEDMVIEPRPGALGIIQNVVFLGSRVEYTVQVGQELLRVQSGGSEAALLRPGEQVQLRLPHKLHLIQEGVPAVAQGVT